MTKKVPKSKIINKETVFEIANKIAGKAKMPILSKGSGKNWTIEEVRPRCTSIDQ